MYRASPRRVKGSRSRRTIREVSVVEDYVTNKWDPPLYQLGHRWWEVQMHGKDGGIAFESFDEYIIKYSSTTVAVSK